MTRGGGGRGGWRYWNSKLEILEAPLASGSIFRRLPPPPVGFEVYKYSETPFRVSKNFPRPPSISSSPLVILNELSLIGWLSKSTGTLLDDGAQIWSNYNRIQAIWRALQSLSDVPVNKILELASARMRRYWCNCLISNREGLGTSL